jgi:hypothetical protein
MPGISVHERSPISEVGYLAQHCGEYRDTVQTTEDTLYIAKKQQPSVPIDPADVDLRTRKDALIQWLLQAIRDFTLLAHRCVAHGIPLPAHYRNGTVEGSCLRWGPLHHLSSYNIVIRQVPPRPLLSSSFIHQALLLLGFQ